MAKTTIVSERLTVRDHGKALTFNASKVSFPASGPSAGRRMSIIADRTDPNWDALNILNRADALKEIIRETAKSRGWKIFIPEISTQMIVIGFHDTIEEVDGFDFVEEIGITLHPPVTAKHPLKKRTHG